MARNFNGPHDRAGSDAVRPVRWICDDTAGRAVAHCPSDWSDLVVAKYSLSHKHSFVLGESFVLQHSLIATGNTNLKLHGSNSTDASAELKRVGFHWRSGRRDCGIVTRWGLDIGSDLLLLRSSPKIESWRWTVGISAFKRQSCGALANSEGRDAQSVKRHPARHVHLAEAPATGKR